MKTKKSLAEIYSFPGFKAQSKFKKGILGDSHARILGLVRRQKKRFVRRVVNLQKVIMINASIALEILVAETCGFIWNLNTAGLIVKDVNL